MCFRLERDQSDDNPAEKAAEEPWPKQEKIPQKEKKPFEEVLPDWFQEMPSVDTFDKRPAEEAPKVEEKPDDKHSGHPCVHSRANRTP
jgi:hypothetical protein